MLLNAILKANPSLNGILFDLPEVIERTSTQGELNNARIKLQSGNYFESLPDNADAYIFKMIVHNWDDASAIKILQTCYRAMPPSGKLLIVEHLIPDNNEPVYGKILDLQMLLIMPGGRERTASQFETLLHSAGFKLTKIIPTKSTFSIIEAEK